MSQANELLNNLSEEELATYTANPETEPHIVINDDRTIVVPAELKKIAVQFDHNVETVTFDCPRYWDGLDMSKMAVYINYKRPDDYMDSYPADNVRVSDIDNNIMCFEWTLSRNATLVKGNLSFLVCVKKTDEDGNEANHWNSELNRELTISEGLECDESAVEQYPDVITQLLLRMDALESGSGNNPGGSESIEEVSIISANITNDYSTDIITEVFECNATYADIKDLVENDQAVICRAKYTSLASDRYKTILLFNCISVSENAVVFECHEGKTIHTATCHSNNTWDYGKRNGELYVIEAEMRREYANDEPWVAFVCGARFSEIKQAVADGYNVVCKALNGTETCIFTLTSIDNDVAVFGNHEHYYLKQAVCYNGDLWSYSEITQEVTDNKTQELSDASNHSQYPSAKAVVDYVDSAIGEALEGDY